MVAVVGTGRDTDQTIVVHPVPQAALVRTCTWVEPELDAKGLETR